MQHFNTVVIGAGSGGMTVAIGLSSLGRPVALIEGKHVGGDCTNVGCVPSKTLIHQVRKYGADGDSRAILATVQRKRDALRDKETEEVQHIEHLTFVRGYARFLGPQRLEVARDDGSREEISADNIVIATGSRPRTTDIPGLPVKRTLTNESLFDLEQAPRHLAIVGAGVVAMEMAFAFRKLGSAVSVIARSGRVLSSAAPEASQALRDSLAEHGIALLTHAAPTHYDDAAQTLSVKTRSGETMLHGVDRVLLAMGRARNLERLDLERAGVAYDLQRGVRVDSFGQTNVPGVYAIGDVTPTSHYTHSANAQGRRVVQRIAFPFLPAVGDEPLFPSAIFSDPEVAGVGMSAKEIAERYHPNVVKRIRIDMRDVDRGYTDDERHGFVLVYAMRLTGKILGVTIVGPRASEMISLFTLAMTQGISLYKLYRIVYPYPTYSNAIGKAADTWMRETLPNMSSEVTAYLRYRLARPAHQANGARRQIEARPQQRLEKVTMQ